ARAALPFTYNEQVERASARHADNPVGMPRVRRRGELKLALRTSMNYRKLGRTNWQVSEIGYGAWGIGGKQWLGGSDDESVQALRCAIDLGLNLIDTALAYGDGHSEKLVGQ